MIDLTADWLRANAPTMIVVLPIVGAAAAFALGHARASWAIAVLACVAAAWLATDLAARQLFGPMAQGDGAPDGFGLFGGAVLAVFSALGVVSAGAALKALHPRAAPAALGLAAIVGAGWCTAVLARDLLIVFVAAEAAWLAGTALVTMGGDRDRAALNGALRMYAAGGVSAVLMLLGVGLLSHSLGSFDLTVLPDAAIETPRMAAAGAGLIIVSLCVKAGVAPLHAWAGAALGRANASAALTLAAIGMVGALAVIVRVSAYAALAPAIGDGVMMMLAALGALSIVVGSVQAIGAQNLQRLAGYSFAAQGGCVLVTLSLGSPAAFAAALIQILAAAASVLALLGGGMAAGGARSLGVLDGLARKAPLASAAIAAGALSMMGAPLTLGFLGRWRMIEVAVGVGWWWAGAAAIGASLAGVFYGGRLIERVFFRRAAEAGIGKRELLRFALAPALAVAVLINLMGVDPALLLAAVSQASETLGSAPP